MILKLRLPVLCLLLLLMGCRAGGPGTPARTVASFFSKYQGRDGFKTTEWSADLLQRLAHVYLGPEVKFPPMDEPPPGHTMRITVERIGGIGPWSS